MEALNSLSVKAVANWFASTLHPINASIRHLRELALQNGPRYYEARMENNIESHLIEKRVFKPGKDFSEKADQKPGAIPADVSRIDQATGEVLGA